MNLNPTKPSDRDVDGLLDEWMAKAAPPTAPDRMLEESFARTMAARQLPVYPWHRLPLGRRLIRGDRGMSRFALSTAVAAAVVVVLVAGLFTRILPDSIRPAALPSSSPAASSSVAPFPAVVLVPAKATVTIPNAIAIATDGRSIFVLGHTRLIRVNPADDSIAASVEVKSASDAFQAVAANRDGVWVTDLDADVLLRFDPQTLKQVASVRPGEAPKDVLATDTALWVSNAHSGTVTRIDPATNKVLATINVGPGGPSGPSWLARGFDSVWVGVPNTGSVVRIDEETNAIRATIAVAKPAWPCGGLAVTTTDVWSATCDSGNVVARIDPATNRVVGTVALGGPQHSIAVVGDRAWLSPEGQPIMRIDPATNRVDRVVSPGVGVDVGGDFVVAAGSLWLIDVETDRLLRLPLSAMGG
jgi:YVTN family beta-propeller protein